MTVDSRVLLVMIQIKPNASYVTVSSKCLTSDFIRISQRRVGPNCRAEKRRRGATHWLNGAMFYTLIGSLLQCSCLFISRPVNNLPASVSVILHLSLTPPPPDFLTVLLFITCSLNVLLQESFHPVIFPSSGPNTLCNLSFSGLSTRHLIFFFTSRHCFSFPKFFLARHHSE